MKPLIIALGLVIAAACNKPSEDNCKKALLNMQHLLGTDQGEDNTGRLESEIRRCKGGSTRESVECAMNATTIDELKKCGFTHLPEPRKK